MDTLKYILLAIDICLIQTSLFFNMTLAIVIYLKRHILSNQVPLVFLRNLLVSQILISLFELIHITDYFTTSTTFHNVSMYSYIMYDAFLSATNFSFTAINLDRYVNIRHPLRYSSILSDRRILIISLCTFAFPVILLLIALTLILAGSSKGYFVTGSLAFGTMVVTSVILLSTNAYIYIVVISHRQRVKPLKRMPDSSSSIPTTIIQNDKETTELQGQLNDARQEKIKRINAGDRSKTNTRMLISVMLLSTSYIAFSIPEIYRLASVLINQSTENAETFIVLVADTSMALSFTIVPISIAMRTKVIMIQIRKCFRKLFLRCTCRQGGEE